ncbi:MAG: M20/M25/M40 family metallo-hydrolase [Acidobacteriota bacterium]|nr:M20/M25/M40 family metallo-hydrolase [Acidobacteriota bacterium]
MKRSALILSVFLVHSGLATADEPVDWEMASRIRHEGFHNSLVMETLEHLTDVIGPRLTGSPAMKEANDWTRERLAHWGLENAHLESWGPFGRGWSFSRASVHMLQPRAVPLLALPKAWTPGTDGPVSGPAMKAVIADIADLEDLQGQVAGKILFIAEPREIEEPSEAAFSRHDKEQLEELAEFQVPEPRDRKAFLERMNKRRALQRAMTTFFVEEGVIAAIDISSRDGGTIRLGGAGSRDPDEDPGVPVLAMSAEQYNWILRLLEDDTEVQLEIDVVASFHDDDLLAYNTIAEMPGSGSSEEIVMVGGHLDSWHPGTGSNDNAAGCAVAMEAVRILQSLGVAPRRTIRIALWSGEEQGLLGSYHYVQEHLVARPEPQDPAERKLPIYAWKAQWPRTLKPEYEQVSAYFNLDNGSGKIRGVYTQENAALVPVFRAWLEPFADLGADTVTNRNTGGTDHLTFDRVGIPGFQFIQDDLDYFTRTHHTNFDVFDHAKADDLKQASVVLASFLYHAAMRPERLPRKPAPTEPAAEDEPEKVPEAAEKPVAPQLFH